MHEPINRQLKIHGTRAHVCEREREGGREGGREREREKEGGRERERERGSE